MNETTVDDRGRLTLPKDVRRRFGDRYYLVELHDGIKLIPLETDPLAALRDEFDEVERSAAELRERSRDAAIDEAGR
ncbi:MAG: AbrB/MazE/SpoVT family DNA-binding domain-containing protein [Halanaeroarchaeum sp.]